MAADDSKPGEVIDWPEEATPPPVLVHEAMTTIEADLALAQHENQRLKLQLATTHTQITELRAELQKAFRTIRALDARLTEAKKTPK